jgi:hypothetical protein
MANRCDQCGEPALDTDTVCWHCGMPLTGHEEQSPASRTQIKEGWQQSTTPTAVIFYVGLTIFIILATVILMAMLGRQPLVQIRLGTRAPINWQEVTAADQFFTLFLPSKWHWLDSAHANQQRVLDDRIAESNIYHLGSQPFGIELDDLVVRFLAQETSESGDQDAAFLIVATSDLLNRLNYDEVRAFLLSSDYAISNVAFVEDYEKSHLRYEIRIDGSDQESISINCRQMLILGNSEAMLVSLCRPLTSARNYENTFVDIMNSFQRLRP